MTEHEQRVAIAEWAGVAPRLAEWWVHSESQKSICMTGTTQKECLEWHNRLPPESPYRKGDWEVIPNYVYPDYVNDLNAIHEAEQKAINKGKETAYLNHLGDVCRPDGAEADGIDDLINAVRATAAQRAEALLRTLNLWKE